jgi:hypothetical protein
MSADDKLIVEPLTNKKWVSTWLGKWPAECDTCSHLEMKATDLSKQEFFIDGKTKMGPWALMCPKCFKHYGIGLGTGYGQKYDSKTREKMEG